MLLTIIYASLVPFCIAHYMPPNGYWSPPPTTTALADSQSITSPSAPSETASTTSTTPMSNDTTSTSSTYTGDITHYEVGVGSCGTTNTDSQAVVALSVAMMANGANPNTNPKCQTTITLVNPSTGSHTQATIVDTCQACAYEDVDLSPTLFVTVAPTGNGRVHGIQWSFDS